jgi:hypothetical protein
MLVALSIVLTILLLYFLILRESAEGGNSKDSKDTNSKDSKETNSKDSKETNSKDTNSKETTIIIVGDGANRDRGSDPFYTMTDPYWATYNHRVGPYPRYFGGYRGHMGHRRIW